jgi:hypothetical protein
MPRQADVRSYASVLNDRDLARIVAGVAARGDNGP